MTEGRFVFTRDVIYDFVSAMSVYRRRQPSDGPRFFLVACQAPTVDAQRVVFP